MRSLDGDIVALIIPTLPHFKVVLSGYSEWMKCGEFHYLFNDGIGFEIKSSIISFLEDGGAITESHL